MFFTTISLLFYFLSVRTTSGYYYTNDLDAKLDELNQKIKPLAQFWSNSFNILNVISQGSYMQNSDLEQMFKELGVKDIDLQGMNINELFEKIIQSLNLQGINSGDVIQSIVQSLGLKGTELLQDLRPLNCHPYKPAVDGNGTTACLRNSSFTNLCTEDKSYPKWYTSQIQKDVNETLTDMASAFGQVNNCGQPPTKECNSRSTSASLLTAQVNRLARGTPVLNATNEFNFVLQTDSVSQGYESRECYPVNQTCVDETGHKEYNCTNVGSGPPHYRVRRTDAINVLLVINSTGFVESASLTEADRMICWCMCDSVLMAH